MRASSPAAGILILLFVSACAAGGQASIHCRVTYCTSAQVYFDAGNEEGLSQGDTLIIARGDTIVGSAVITATTTHSSVGRPLLANLPPQPGDTGVIAKEWRPSTRGATGVDSAGSESPAPVRLPSDSGRESSENVPGGRIGIQYNGQHADDPRLNINEPAVYAHTRVDNLGGTGLSLALYGRAYYDAGGTYLRYGDSTHTRVDITELSIGFHPDAGWLGFSAGRFISGYVTGTGPLDGGEVYLRQGQFTAGALAGTGVRSRVFGTGANQMSAGGFLAFHDGESFLDSYDVSGAYVRQTVGGNLDREYLSLQNSVTTGREFSAYASADVELKSMTGGVIMSHPALSSVLLSVNYTPARWLSANFGYDGTRGVYLFESMKSVSDSLFHQALDQGFRLSGTIRPGDAYTFTFEASVNSNEIDGGSSHTLGAGVRASDIFSSGVFGSLRYRNLGGSFLGGSQTTIEIGRSIFRLLDASLQYDSRSYTVARLKQTYTTQSFSGDVNYWISRHLYGMFRADYVLDNTMNSLQYFLEVGFRF